MAKHIQIIITGKVENTGFRFYAFKWASEFQINGNVRQESGKVIIEAEGRESDLENYIHWCRKRPWAGEIEDFHIIEKSIVGYNEFRIL